MPQLYMIVIKVDNAMSGRNGQWSDWITEKKAEVYDFLAKGARVFLFPQMMEVTSAEVVITP